MENAARALIVGLILVVSAPSAPAQTVTELLISGDPGAKLDLVIVGDGFTAADQAAYNAFVQTFVVSGVFGEGAFAETMNAFNIYRVNVDSVDSGVTRVDSTGAITLARNTALDYHYSGLWARCWMEAGPNTAANVTNLLDSLVPQRDFEFIVLNEPGFGGCRTGARLAVTTGGSWPVGSHEMGHMVGNLADEYCKAGTYAGAEPGRANVTATSNLAALKWRAFVRPGTPIPTGVNATPGSGACTGYNSGPIPTGWNNDQDVGLFEGAQYNDSAIYRPVVSCRMRSNTPSFCPVCYTQLREMTRPMHEHTFRDAHVGDFNGDGRDDLVLHNANSLSLYLTADGRLELKWITTGQIPGWGAIGAGDRLYVADFNGDGSDDLFVFNPSDGPPRFGMFRSNGTSFECVRRFDLELPGWDDMRVHDEFFVADFNGDGREDLYVFNGRDWAVGYLEMLQSVGADLIYTRRYDADLPGWGPMRPNDRFFVADFNGDRRKDLYVFNGLDWSIGYLEMMCSSGSSLSRVHRYDEDLPGWDDMKPHDLFLVADFDGDCRDDLYVFNGADWSIAYIEMLRSTGCLLENARRYDGQVPGWGALETSDRFFVADFNGDRRDDLYVYNAHDWAVEYLGMLRSSGNALSGTWQADWIGAWDLGPLDDFLVANLEGSAGWDDLFVRNDERLGMLRSHASWVSHSRLYPRWIHNLHYHENGWW